MPGWGWREREGGRKGGKDGGRQAGIERGEKEKEGGREEGKEGKCCKERTYLVHMMDDSLRSSDQIYKIR